MKKVLVYYKKRKKLIFSRLPKTEDRRYCRSCAYDDKCACNLYRKYDIDHNKLLCCQDIYRDESGSLNKNYMYVAKEDNTVQK